MSAADVIAMTQEAPVAMTEEIPMTEPLVQVVDEDEDEDVVVVRRKRARPVEKGASDPANDDDVSPRGPFDASQQESPPKSSDDEGADANGIKLPGKKKLKLRTKAKAEEAELMADDEDEDAEPAMEDDDGEDFYYDEDDEEGMMEKRLAENGTLSDDEGAGVKGDVSESDESDFNDSEDEFEDAAEKLREMAKARAAANASGPPPENETEEELAARMAREKEETKKVQEEIMKEAGKRVRLTGYHVAPDRDPFAYRKIIAIIREKVAALNLPPPPPDPVVSESEDDENDGEEVSDDDLDDDEEAEDDSQAGDEREEEKEKEEEEMMELEVDDDVDGLTLDDENVKNELLAILAEVKANAAAKKPVEEPKAKTVDFDDEETIAAERAAQQLAAQLDEAKELGGGDGEDAEDDEDSEDDLSEEEAFVDMTRKERQRQLKKAKAFFKADAKANKRREGGAFEDEAEMSDDGGHTDDEEQVEVEELGEENERVIRRKVASRNDGLLDRDELEEMVDYIDFNDTADDDERRAAKRAAAHARFEEEKDEEDLRKMKEALKNGFRRPNRNNGYDADGPDYWQRRRKANGESESDDEDLGIDVPDRAWEAVELSDDDDGEWAERAERRKKAAAAAEAAKKLAANDDSNANAGDGDSQLPSARDFASQDFSAMLDAGRARRNNRVRRGTSAAAAAMDNGAGAFSQPAPVKAVGRVNSAPGRVAPAPLLERGGSMSFLGRGSGSNHSAGGLARSVSLGNGGASRSFVFGGGGDSQSMWEKDAEEQGTMAAPANFAELGSNENARFGWAPREAMSKHPAAAGKSNGASTAAAPSRLGTGGASTKPGKSLFSMLQDSQDWDDVLGKSDSLTEGVKAAANIKLRPAALR
jgi:hypothetical protein